eukprot:2444117-Pleurochrysis_carterae.AAC.1
MLKWCYSHAIKRQKGEAPAELGRLQARRHREVEDDVLDVVATAIGLLVDVRRIVAVVVAAAAASAALLPAPLVLLLDKVFVLVAADDLAEVAL